MQTYEDELRKKLEKGINYAKLSSGITSTQLKSNKPLPALRFPPQMRLKSAVENIVKFVQQEGDKALFELTEKFDKIKLDSLIVTPQQIAEATGAYS